MNYDDLPMILTPKDVMKILNLPQKQIVKEDKP